MADESEIAIDTIAVDDALRHWRQGDCVLGEHWFLYRDAAVPAGVESMLLSMEEGRDGNIESPVKGFVVLTQSCDIARSNAKRPFVEVCPLVAMDPVEFGEVRKARVPRYAFVPGIEDRALVADLDRTMTVTKTVIAKWERVRGCASDEQARKFAGALSRKRGRFAFPDDFTEFAEPLRKRLQDKHGKSTAEGDALRDLREIRVNAAPSWEATEVVLTFWFIAPDDDPRGSVSSSSVDRWLDLIPANGRFVDVYGQLVALEDITAADYVNSDPLDLDHLSILGTPVPPSSARSQHLD